MEIFRRAYVNSGAGFLQKMRKSMNKKHARTQQTIQREQQTIVTIMILIYKEIIDSNETDGDLHSFLKKKILKLTCILWEKNAHVALGWIIYLQLI